MKKQLRIGTRESQLARWQAEQVLSGLSAQGFEACLVFIHAEGDLDLHTPLYEMGVQGIFTRSLDTALLNNRIDLAVHSMKDVPIQPPAGIRSVAVLPRGPQQDILVPHPDSAIPASVYESLGLGITIPEAYAQLRIATSSIRRKAQWLNRYPADRLESFRGNVNTRLRKLKENGWHGAIFAAAGLERIGLRPAHAVNLDWMLPAPAQGAILIQAREHDGEAAGACQALNDPQTALCTEIERDFLKALLGGCSTPIGAMAERVNQEIIFKGNILSVDGKKKAEVKLIRPAGEAEGLGREAARELLANGGQEIAESLKDAGQ